MKKNKTICPFVKWSGGKRQLIPAITELLPQTFSTYYEAFVGGGAVLFEIKPKKAVVNDLNTELVNTYNVVKNQPDELIEDLKTHINQSEYFYKITELDRQKGFDELSNVRKASRFLFLNKTGFRGIYKVNKLGQFNSGFGFNKNPNIVNEVAIRSISEYFNDNDITIINGDFESAVKDVKKGDFVYFDPPYDPVSKNSFTGYTQFGFNIFDQVRLREICDELDKKGVKFLASNSATPFILDQYSNYNVNFVKAKRSLGLNRGKVDEVLIRNYE